MMPKPRSCAGRGPRAGPKEPADLAHHQTRGGGGAQAKLMPTATIAINLVTVATTHHQTFTVQDKRVLSGDREKDLPQNFPQFCERFCSRNHDSKSCHMDCWRKKRTWGSFEIRKTKLREERYIQKFLKNDTFIVSTIWNFAWGKHIFYYKLFQSNNDSPKRNY